MEILTLLKANIKRRKRSFLSIFILMMIVTLSMTVILSVTDQMKSSIENSLETTGTADLMAVVPDQYVTEKLYQEISGNQDLEYMTDVETMTVLKATINGMEQKSYMNLCAYEGSLTATKVEAGSDDYTEGVKDKTYQFFSTSGTSYDNTVQAPGKGEIYVPYCFQTIYHCKIGDQCVITTNYGTVTLTIQGFYEEPLSGAYVINLKQALISEEDYELLAEKADTELDASEKCVLPYHELNFYQREDSQLDAYEFRQSLNEDSKVISYAYGTLSKEDAVTYTLMLPKINGNMMLAFVAMLFLVVLIVMGNNISTSIEMEYVNLGVLKALGYSKRELRFVLMAEYMAAELAGAVVGMLLSLAMIRPLELLFMKITGILPDAGISFFKCIGILIIIFLISGFFIYYKTIKVGGISPVRAIRGGREAVYFDHIGTVKIKKKAMNFRLAARQFGSNRKQYVGLMLIVAILVYFLLSVTILTRGVKVESVYEIFGGITSDVSLSFEESYTHEQMNQIVDAVNEITPVTYSVSMLSRYLTVDGNQYNATIYDDPTQFKSITKGKAPEYENEIIVTELVSKMLGKGIGETVTVAYRDGEAEYTISGIYQSSVEVGKCIGISLAGADRIGTFEPSVGYLRVADQNKIDEVTALCNERFGSYLTAERADNTDYLNSLIRLSLKVVTVFIFTITIAFVLVVVAMSCRKMFLKERQDIGIYKALGFEVKQLRLQFAYRFLFISICGVIIGLILTALLNNQMMLYLFRYIGVTSYEAQITASVLLIPSATICLCFFLAAYLLARQVKKVAVTELVVE